jgi:hypothetical protein
MLQTDRKQIADLLVQFVTESYDSWKNRQSGREPNLTATILRDAILQMGDCPRSLKLMAPRQRDSSIRTILASLVREGALGTSIGSGEHGREARCYEPKTPNN